MLVDFVVVLDIAHHKNTPTLSTWAVARKSLEGENDTLVATLEVRNASIKRPVGTSNVRITESKAVAINHRESGEKVCKCIRKEVFYIEP
jgi:hypothetical protein